MADFQQSLFSKRKVSNGNAYDDVFGGPPKYSVPSVPSRVDDYSEIFGNFFAPRTSSIPVLDFPLLDDDRVCLDVPNSKFDYTEVFGGFDAADFAVPYEELFLERQAPQNPFRNSWSHDEGAAEQVPDVVSTAPLEQDGRDFLTSLDMNQSFSNGTSEHIYNGTEQFSVSYNKSNQGSKREPLSGTTHIAHLHDVPGYTVVVDSCPLLNKNKYDSSVVSKPGLSPKGDSIGEAMEEIHSREISSPILDEVAMTSENEIVPDEKHLCSKQIDQKDVLDSGNSDTHCFSNKMPSVQKASLKQIHLQATASDGTSAGDQHKSCNPVADLPSVADNPSEKVVFLTISDINLRTQPSQLPPPSRPPPKLGNSKKLNASQSELYSRRPMKTTETYHFGSSFDTYALLDNDVTPPFFDVEVDASSAAAAAMRVAMEKAQAKLKSAKESMERKKDGYQVRMKLNLNEDKNMKEQRMSRTTRENNMLKDEESLDSSATWKPDIKDFARADRWKMMNTTEIASDYERKMDRTELTAASKDKWHGKNFTGSHDALQQEKKASDWKVEKQYYELINNEKAFRLAAENNEMNLKTIGRNPMFVAKAVKEEGILENNDTFKALKEPYLQKDRNQTPKVGKTACKLEEESKAARPYAQDREIEKNVKVLQTSKESLKQEDLRWKVDKMVHGHNEYVYGLNVACENERGERGQKLDFEREKEEKRWDMAYECVGDEHVSIVGELAHMHKWEEHCERDEEQKRQKAAHELEEEEKRLKVVREREKEDRSIKAARKHEEEEKRLKAACEHEEEEKRLKAACEREEEEKRHKAAHDHEEEEKRLKVAIEHEEVEKRLSAAYEHEKEERRLKAARKCEEEEKRLKAAWELEAEEKKVNAAHECREGEMGLKAAREHDEEVMRLKAACEVEEEKKVEVARKLEDEKKRLQTAFPCEEVKTFNAVWVHVQEEKRLKETRECQEDRRKYACETEEENKRTSIVHAEEEKRLEANCMKGLERDTVKASQGCEVKEKITKENQNEKERSKYEPEEEINSKIAYDACDTERYGKNSEASKDTYKLVETVEWEVIGAELKTLHTGRENEEAEKKKPSVRQQEESEMSPNSLHTGRENEEAEKKKPSVRQQEESEMLPNSKTSYGCDANEKQGRGDKKHKRVQDTDVIENKKKVAVDTVLPEEKINGQGLKEARMGGGRDGNATTLKAAYEDLEGEETNKKQTMTCEDVENMKEGDSIPLWPGEGKNIKGIHDVHRQAYNETKHKTDQATMKQEKKGVNEANGLMKNKNSVYECLISLDKDKGSNSLTASRKIIKEAEDRRKETVQLNGGKIDKTSLVAQERGREEKKLDKTYDKGEREREERLSRERELEKERLRKLEEEREREREREKDRIAVERATREARERAATEARERAERAAVERALAEARQRALADARERAEKASLAEKASNEAVRLKAERAAVERATAEARERAAEKAAERAAARDKPDSPLRQNTATDIQDFRGTQDESALRCKARLERHQRTVERAAKALAEKNMRDVLAQREQAERNRLAETLDADIRRWANGKEGNLRALLSTLQYILGPESGWQPVPLTDVITAVAVKRAYRKATLCVHPDKVQQRCATIQQKYICEKVFDLLKEAWNRFNSEER